MSADYGGDDEMVETVAAVEETNPGSLLPERGPGCVRGRWRKGGEGGEGKPDLTLLPDRGVVVLGCIATRCLVDLVDGLHLGQGLMGGLALVRGLRCCGGGLMGGVVQKV